MNRFKLLALVIAATGMASSAYAAFTPGSLVILTDPNTGTASGAITLDEYTFDPATGVFGSTPAPHALTGITISGDTDHSGLLHISTDGSSLVFGGYLAPVNTPTVDTTTTSRAIGVVDSNWNLSTVPLTVYSGLTIRSVSSTDGKHFWTGGDQAITGTPATNGGQFYVDSSGAIVSQVQINVADSRANRIDHGQLWSISSSVGGASKYAGLPTSAASSTLTLTGGYAKSDIVFLDLNNDGVSDTAYTTDGKNLLGKWTYNGTSWAAAGTWDGVKGVINNINSLEAYVYNGTVELLAATQAGQLFQFADANGINTGFGPAFANTSPMPLFSATDGSVFRGMAIIPVPEPTLLATLLPVLAFLSRRKSR